MSRPFPVVSIEEMRALEAAAVASGTPERELQERAGRVVAEVIASRLRESRAAIAVLVGPGNNGRDAVVAARYLAPLGHDLHLFLSARHALTTAEIDTLRSVGMELTMLADGEGGSAVRRALAHSHVAVDGLLGVGARGPMRDDLAELARLLNEARQARPGLTVVAVDVPSGVDADDGSVPGAAVRADVTVTFGAVKAGLLRFPAAHHVGELEPRSIELPEGASARLPTRVLDDAAARPLLPPRPLDAHKYRLGRTLVVAGSDAYVGAASLCAAAAARSGCGLVAMASTRAVKQILAVRLPEATYPVPPFEAEQEPEAAADRLAELLPDYQAVVVGPGVGRSGGVERFLRRLLEANGRSAQPTPAVIDADALSLLAAWDGWWDAIGPGHVLTPHAGELARLTGRDVSAATEPPWELVRQAARRWGQVVVFKGPFTSVAAPFGEAWVYPRANPALASAGTGDVLAGLCAGLAAQSAPPFDAARLAVVVHALSARQVIDERGWRTLLASDLLDQIPRALRALERGLP